jgi:hypothetical protein
MLYNIDIWLEIVRTIWNSAESSNFSCAQVKCVHKTMCFYARKVSRGLWSQRNKHLGTRLEMRVHKCSTEVADRGCHRRLAEQDIAWWHKSSQYR